LTADVEHAAAERERNREPGEDQRRRDEQRLLDVELGRDPLVAGDPGEEPVRPVPLKIPWYVEMGLWPVAATTIPPMKNAMIVVMIGVITPPARW
jgi:hypothetical protein